MISKKPKSLPFCSYYLLKWLSFVLFVLCTLVGLFLLYTSDVQGQPSYTFSYHSSSPSDYQEIQDDSIVTSYPVADLFIVNELNGETFWFYNLPFTFGGLTSLSFGQNGFLRLDNDSSLIIIDGVNTRLSLLDSTSKVSYAITGNQGNLLFKLQYKNIHLDNGPAGNFSNFQIWYYQNTGDIEIHYGPRSLNNASGYTTANGPNVGMFYSDIFFTQCYEKIWCTVNPANPVLNTAANYVFSALPGIPDDGAVFKFSPTFSVSVPRVNGNSSFMVFPNPMTDQLVLKYSLEVIQTIDIYIANVQGEVVKIVASKESLATGEYNRAIDVSALSKGIYFLHLNSGDKSIVQKLIKM